MSIKQLTLTALLLAPLARPCAAEAPLPAQKPNILVVLADDLGYGELGCQGNPEVPTPHIDSLATNGVRFTDGYVTAPVCTPSRAGLITGRYQQRFGHELNATGKQNLAENVGLPLSQQTLADYLKAAGYATGIIGKWHLGGTPKFHPQKRGFDEFFGFLHEGHFYTPPPYRGVYSRFRPTEPPYDADNPLLRGAEPIEEPDYLTTAFTREAVAFIERHKREPFFLYLPYNAVHSPMQAPVKEVEQFKNIAGAHRAIFAGMLKALDDSVGAVLSKLRENGLEDRTLIFFLSDNGGPTAELTSSNLPLSGGKGQLWEGGIREPFLVQWKGRLPAGKVYHQPVISLDIAATVLAAAGIKTPAPPGLDGVNLLPFLTGEASRLPHETLFWRYGAQAALRQGDWKLLRRGNGSWQLFNLVNDLEEKNDLATREPALVKSLATAWDDWNRQLVPPLWGK